MRRIRSSYWLQTKRTLARPAVRRMADSEEMFLTEDEALQAGPKSKRQRVAPVQRKPAAKPEASDEANEFKTGDEAEPLATPLATPVQKKPAAKPMSDAADKAEESVRKKPAAKLTADASDDAEGNDFQTTDEEPLATAAPRSKAKPKPKGATQKTSIPSCQASTAEEPGSDEFHTEDDSPVKPPPKSRKAKSVAKECKRIHADAASGDATNLPEASGTFTYAHWLALHKLSGTELQVLGQTELCGLSLFWHEHRDSGALPLRRDACLRVGVG